MHPSEAGIAEGALSTSGSPRAQPGRTPACLAEATGLIAGSHQCSLDCD